MSSKSSKAAIALTALVPLAAFLIAETVTGNLLHITPTNIILNLEVYYLLYFGFFAIFGSTRIAWPILNLLLYLFATAEYFVISFRERPIMIWDVLALRTALTVSSSYKYEITPRLVISFLLVVVWAVLIWKFPFSISGTKQDEKLKKLLRVQLPVIWAAVSFTFGFMLFAMLVPTMQLDVHMWDPIVSFEKEGFLLSTLVSLKTPIPDKPDGYSKEAAEILLTELEEDRAGEDSAVTTPTNVICIMNESFADLRLYNDLSADRSFRTDREYLSYFDSLDFSGNVQKGILYVPVFGAMTANSEYEFLTGNACVFTPQGSVPYQFYMREGDDSLARIFGENGYRTVAMHPYPGYNWNRTEAYRKMGFDEFLDLDYYDSLGRGVTLELPRGYMSDRSDYDGIIRLIEEKAQGEKLFVFNVTMQNHGGFEVAGFESNVHVTELNGEACTGEYPKADQYLTLMRMSDEALQYLLEYCEALDEPTMVVMFGDHQPSVETPFFEALYGTRWSEVPDSLKLNSFVTPYLIWTNYERGAEDSGEMSVFMLGNQVLTEAGIPLAGFRAQTEKLKSQYQAVHPMGVLDREGNFTGVLEAQGLDHLPEVSEFHILQYYRMFEKRQ